MSPEKKDLKLHCSLEAYILMNDVSKSKKTFGQFVVVLGAGKVVSPH